MGAESSPPPKARILQGHDFPGGPGALDEPLPSFSFAVLGDNQFGMKSCHGGMHARTAIPEVILSLSPDFVVHTGDLMAHGYEDGAYDVFRKCYADMLSRVLFFPTMGNHDAAAGGVLNYKAYLEEQLFLDNPFVYGPGYDSDFLISYEDDPTDYSNKFHMPSHEEDVPSGISYKTFYAVRHAHALFLFFEQGTRWWTNTPLSWLEKHLMAARADPSVRHVFVVLHHPMYSTSIRSIKTDQVKAPYEELLRAYDVTAVFSGHTHIYERFYVPDDGRDTRTRKPPGLYPHDGAGIHYVVTGGGGASKYKPCDPWPPVGGRPGDRYLQAHACPNHFVFVEVEGDLVRFTTIAVRADRHGHEAWVMDRFSIGG
jgi:hypothetical protein